MNAECIFQDSISYLSRRGTGGLALQYMPNLFRFSYSHFNMNTEYWLSGKINRHYKLYSLYCGNSHVFYTLLSIWKHRHTFVARCCFLQFLRYSKIINMLHTIAEPLVTRLDRARGLNIHQTLNLWSETVDYGSYFHYEQ